MGRLLSVNVSPPGRTLRLRGRDEATGIFKEPVTRAVAIGPLGLEGDVIVDTRYHGGTEKAVYAYAAEDYAWWEKELGEPLPPGTFGENLTLEGVDLSGARVGDVLAVGDVRLEATSPRTPCGTLAARMGDPKIVKRFLHAERLGVYFRVARPGAVKAGDAAGWESRAESGALLLDLARRPG